MTSASISITHPKTALPTCTPNLMPFHVDYSGPAPISTYFRVKVPIEEMNPEAKGSGFQNRNGSWQSQMSAAFRGRVLRGLEVKLPEGYSGMVLRSDASTSDTNIKSSQSARQTKSKASARDTKKGRTSRRGYKKANTIDADEDVECSELQDEDSLSVSAEAINGTLKMRMLKPSAAFSSMVVWNPDVPVDESRDEYIRALNEWVSVAAEVSPTLCFLSHLSQHLFPGPSH